MDAEQPDLRARLADLEAEMGDWSRAHPAATLAAIEHEVDRRLRAIRAEMLATVAGVHDRLTRLHFQVVLVPGAK